MDKNKFDIKKKTMRRRSHTRKLAQDSMLNIAEARREIVNALHLHRASSSSSSSSSSNSSSSSFPSLSYQSYPTTPYFNMMGGGVHQHYTLLMEPLPIPLPQPTWSTTSPSIHPTLPMEVLEFEFEWGDNNIASSYTWWLGFLKSLDKPNEEKEERGTTYPFGDELEMESFKRLFTKTSSASSKGGGEASCLEIEDQRPILDEWLTVPTTESTDQMDDEQEVNDGF